MRTIGENIRYYRKRAGLTLKELEEEIGTHYSNICRWEKNSQLDGKVWKGSKARKKEAERCRENRKENA